MWIGALLLSIPILTLIMWILQVFTPVSVLITMLLTYTVFMVLKSIYERYR